MQCSCCAFQNLSCSRDVKVQSMTLFQSIVIQKSIDIFTEMKPGCSFFLPGHGHFLYILIFANTKIVCEARKIHFNQKFTSEFDFLYALIGNKYYPAGDFWKQSRFLQLPSGLFGCVFWSVIQVIQATYVQQACVREHLHSWQTVQHTAPVQLRQSFWPWAAANRNCLKPKGAGHGLSIIINVNTISWSLYNFSGLDTQQLQFVILGPGKPWIYSKPSFYQNLAIIAQLCAAPLLAYF